MTEEIRDKITRFVVHADVWELQEGQVKSLRFNENIYTMATEQKSKPKIKKKAYRKKPRAIEKWIIDNNIWEFKPDDFLKTQLHYPICKLDKTLSKMIEEEKLIQMSNNTFRITKKFNDLVKELK